MNKNHKQPAYSLIFAFLIMTVIMIVAGTTIENTQNKVRYFNELEGTSQARLAAESAAEMAVQEIRDYQFGYQPSDATTAFCMDAVDGGSCTGESIGTTYGGYEVYATATENDYESDGYYYIPIPGTGTAGSDDECSLIDEHVSADDPCNWNKWMYGETIVLPMYGVDSSGAFVNPANVGVYDWFLRVRTPCVGDYDDECERYSFDADATDVTTDPSLIFWHLTGEYDDGSGPMTIDLYPNDAISYVLDGFGIPTGEIERSTSNNTEIPASFIDDGVDDGTYVVFEMFDSEEFGDYMETDTTVTSLELQLDLITTLTNVDDGSAIPYLEWQVYMDTSDPPLISPVTAIKGEGYYEGKEGTYYFPYVVTRSSTGESSSIYTLSN